MIITLPCYGIVVTLDDENPGGGHITSKLHERCPECNKIDCYAECKNKKSVDEIQAFILDAQERFYYNACMDAIESMILGHACSGVDITTDSYIEGVAASVQSCANDA